MVLKLPYTFWAPFAFGYIFICFFPDIGKRYDLDFQSPQKSGQNFKSAEDMIELYKELCSGTPFYLDLPNGNVVIYSAYALCLFWIFLFEFVEYPIVSIEDPFDKEDWEHIKYISSLGICQVFIFFLILINYYFV